MTCDLEIYICIQMQRKYPTTVKFKRTFFDDPSHTLHDMKPNMTYDDLMLLQLKKKTQNIGCF